MSSIRESKTHSQAKASSHISGSEVPKTRGRKPSKVVADPQESSVEATGVGDVVSSAELLLRIQELEDHLEGLFQEFREYRSSHAPRRVESRSDEPLEIPSGPIRTKEEMYRKGNVLLNETLHRRLDPIWERQVSREGSSRSFPQVFGDRHVRELLVMFLRDLVGMAVAPSEDGHVYPKAVALPEGFGSIKLTVSPPRQKRTPQGKNIALPARYKMRLDFGSTVDSILDALPSPPVSEEA